MNRTSQSDGGFTAKNPQARPCVCTHPYQDARYGVNMRLHNPTKDGWRCTVCNREDKTK